MATVEVAELEKEIGHVFINRDLLFKALTHSSTGQEKNYERLEFLGDRVLGLVIAQVLFEKFPAEAEGDLAKRLAALVEGSLLAEVAREIDLGRHVFFSHSERESGGAQNDNILADVFEALVGALYLDAGFPACRDLIERLWMQRFYDMKAPPQHPKTALQEWAQGQGLPLPVYTISQQTGPAHAPVFSVRLAVRGFGEISAQGRSRQEAEKAAAQDFLSARGVLL